MTRQRVFTVLLGPIALVSALAARTETTLPDRLAGFRSWGRLTKEPQIVPYQLAYRCAILPPRVEDLERHGPHTHHWIMVYANSLADAALRDQAARHFPAGAIIAKEKRAAPGGSQSDGIAFMINHPVGEFTSSGGWEFLYYPASGTKVSYDSCISCHRAGAAKDYVFGRYGEPDAK